VLTYVKRPDGKIDEMMTVVKNLRNRDIQTGSVVLDFKLCQVVKASMGEKTVPKDWDRVVGYYYQHYANIIERLFAENGHELPKIDKPA
jgi:hypothetical protein